VHASTFDSFEQAYRDIAKEMSIPGTEDPQADNLNIVRDWLSKAENGSWLFILDNADDLDLFFGVNSSTTTSTTISNHRHISDFLPKNANSVIIMTTRDRRIGQRFTDREGEIMITPLASKDAEQLLLSKIPLSDRVNYESLQTLVEILGNIPLAITQAAAFIQENSMSVQTYIEELKASDSDLQDYLDESLPDPRRYPRSENSVTRTWKLSFDQIAIHFPRAADILSLMVQLDRRAIPKAFLKQKNECSIEFNKAIGTLQAYSLIKTETGGSNFEVHRLIQLSTQRWLSLQHKQTEWQEKALELIAEAFPSGDYGTWKECKSLLLHAKYITKHNNTHDSLLLQRVDLLENMANYDQSQGRFEASYLQYKDALQTRDSILGKTHPSTLTTMGNLALVLSKQGKYAEAEAMNRQTLELKEEILGKTYPLTLITMGNLALVLSKQGKYTEAEAIYRQTLGLKEEVLGKTHPETLISISNLALVLSKQGKYAEAEAMNRQTLGLKEEVFGKTHPETLISVYCLAYLLQKKEEYEEASLLYQRACTGCKLSLGSEHPTTIACTHHYSIMLEGIKEG
jgi:tetratricopeptide (TPR) repeat protein